MKILIASALLSLTFMACNQPSGNTGAQADTNQKQQMVNTPGSTTGQFSIAPVISAYLNMKNDLAKDDSKAAAESGKQLFVILKGVDMRSIPADKHKAYMDIADNAKENAEHIGDNTGNIGHQREHFIALSKDMNDLIAMFGAPQQLYQDHCPMYNDGKGAYWISETREIKNPYYGAEMSTCGSMKKEYQQ